MRTPGGKVAPDPFEACSFTYGRAAGGWLEDLVDGPPGQLSGLSTGDRDPQVFLGVNAPTGCSDSSCQRRDAARTSVSAASIMPLARPYQS